VGSSQASYPINDRNARKGALDLFLVAAGGAFSLGTFENPGKIPVG